MTDPAPVDGPAVHRLVDHLIPRVTAERAMRLYDSYLLSQDDPVYAFQRAWILACEELGMHRHLRPGAKR